MRTVFRKLGPHQTPYLGFDCDYPCDYLLTNRTDAFTFSSHQCRHTLKIRPYCVHSYSVILSHSSVKQKRHLLCNSIGEQLWIKHSNLSLWFYWMISTYFSVFSRWNTKAYIKVLKPRDTKTEWSIRMGTLHSLLNYFSFWRLRDSDTGRSLLVQILQNSANGFHMQIKR